MKAALVLLYVMIPVTCLAVPDPGTLLSPATQRLLIVGNITFLLLSTITLILLRRRKKLAVRLREAELQVQLCQAQLEPHFIYNTLSVLGYYIRKGEQAGAESFLGDFSGLLRRYLENSSKMIIPLTDELQVVERFLLIQKKRYANLFDYAVHVSPALDQRRTFVFPMLLQPFAENAIEHGFRGLDHTGKLLILIKEAGRALIFTIEDNGKGLQGRSSVPQDSTRPHALEIIKARLNLLNRFYPGAYLLKMEDLTRPGTTGVRVTISIPFLN